MLREAGDRCGKASLFLFSPALSVWIRGQGHVAAIFGWNRRCG